MERLKLGEYRVLMYLERFGGSVGVGRVGIVDLLTYTVGLFWRYFWRGSEAVGVGGEGMQSVVGTREGSISWV